MKESKKRKNDLPDRKYAAPTRLALKLTNLSDERTDPMGSYTGQPDDPFEQPVQDADDL